MYGIDVIKKMNREAAKEAQGKQPFIAFCDKDSNICCPNFGDYRAKGWRLVKTYFVDHSGFGQPGEMALTIAQFIEKVKEGRGYAVIETGQFQCYVGEFIKLKGK